MTPPPPPPKSPRTAPSKQSQSQSQSQGQAKEQAKAPSGQKTAPVCFAEHMRGDQVHGPYKATLAELDVLPQEERDRRRAALDRHFRRRGITFAVYGDEGGTERLIPFDPVPRILSAPEWATVSQGCIQRVKALNAFLADVHGKGEIIKAGKVPAEMVHENELFCKAMAGVALPHGVHAHIAGVDVVRTGPDDWYVLEDNLRTPSGVSYMLENRLALQRQFPELFRATPVQPVDHYPDLLLRALKDCAPEGVDNPEVVILTPGSFNSAYFEHTYLAERMQIKLVEGSDLFVEGGYVWMHTTAGKARVDVIYRRIDDDFLDPKVFREDSALGVAGLVEVARAGHVTLTNAIGNGVADDKAIYLFVPEMIRFYLGEEPLIKNVPTWCCAIPSECTYVLEHLAELVVKEVHGSGGYGMLVGPASTKAQIEAYRKRILDDPSDFIAQPTLALSTCPTWTETGIAPRHVDLRPYVISGKTVDVVPGALTRVALREGSLVVNSSQGGGTKDTWVLGEDASC
jgi:uncharacterized circularly permuted ATP-grasp superfamily protein